jgi:hypothetical protein
MDNILSIILDQIIHGGPQMIALLSLIVGLLLLDRKRLTNEMAKKDDRLNKIVDEYYKGNISLAEALNSVKLVLYEIKLKL